MQQDQYIYVCLHLHYYHSTSHHTKIISPHTHTRTQTYNIRMHITYITNYRLHPVHISLTHYQSDPPVHAHTYIHTYKFIHHHHHPSITIILPLPLLFFLFRLSLGKLLTCGVIRSYIFWHINFQMQLASWNPLLSIRCC